MDRLRISCYSIYMVIAAAIISTVWIAFALVIAHNSHKVFRHNTNRRDS